MCGGRTGYVGLPGVTQYPAKAVPPSTEDSAGKNFLPPAAPLSGSHKPVGAQSLTRAQAWCQSTTDSVEAKKSTYSNTGYT